jgi:predicted TIM-barrel fold metal-dependent hydrolase
MKAIDVHVHPSTFSLGDMAGREIGDATARYFRSAEQVKTLDEMVADYRNLDVKGVLIAETVSGLPGITNDYVAGVVRDCPEVFPAGWAMVDPWKGERAVAEAERAISDLGLIGLKFQPTAQAFRPDDERFYPLYQKCVDLRVPILMHSGTTGLGAGLPGAAGLKLDYARPIPYVDNLAADFPGLTIICAHTGWPWTEELIAVLLHKGNVFCELSGWAPKYFPESLKREINGRLQDKFMFGSDYPNLHPKRLLDEWEAGAYKPEVLEKVFYMNARRILGL